MANDPIQIEGGPVRLQLGAGGARSNSGFPLYWAQVGMLRVKAEEAERRASAVSSAEVKSAEVAAQEAQAVVEHLRAMVSRRSALR